MMHLYLTSRWLILLLAVASSPVFGQTADDWFTTDSIKIQIQDCAAGGELCVPIKTTLLTSNFSITSNDNSYTGVITACDTLYSFVYDFSAFLGNGIPGPYVLQPFEVNGQVYVDTFLSVPMFVTMLQTWFPEAQFSYDPITQKLDGLLVHNFPSLFIGFTSVSGIPPVEVVVNQGAIHERSLLHFPQGIHDVVFIETATMDTSEVVLLIACIQSDTIDVHLLEGASDEICMNNDQLLSTDYTTHQLCDKGDGIMNYSNADTAGCFQYQSLGQGHDTLCLVMCDIYGFCDTVTYAFSVTPQGILDTAYIDLFVGESELFCINQDLITGLPVDTVEACLDNFSGSFDYLLNPNLCIQFDALMEGIDTVCIELIQQTGMTDIFTFIVNTTVPKSTSDILALKVGDDDLYCVDTTELHGNIISIENVCPDTENATLSALDATTFCLGYIGEEVGKDTFCLVICDDLNICDTTYLIINVLDQGTPILPPATNPDVDSTRQGVTTAINVLSNDIIPNNNIDTFFILPISEGGLGPIYGTASFDAMGAITYTPDPEYCDVVDTINYVVCNQLACDTSYLAVNVICDVDAGDDIVVYNGISPNNDGANDTWRIIGLDNFTSHSVIVFNRWGNRIFSSDNYQNDWTGTWDDSTALPDGTYFYIIEYDGKITSGDLQIFR